MIGATTATTNSSLSESKSATTTTTTTTPFSRRSNRNNNNNNNNRSQLYLGCLIGLCFGNLIHYIYDFSSSSSSSFSSSSLLKSESESSSSQTTTQTTQTTSSSSSLCIDGGYQIFGYYPECIPYVDLYTNNYSVAFHMLAYDLEGNNNQYTFEAFENAKQLGIKFPSNYDIIISISQHSKSIIPILKQEWKSIYPSSKTKTTTNTTSTTTPSTTPLSSLSNWISRLKIITLTNEEFDIIPNGQYITSIGHTPTYKKMNRFRVKTQFELDLIKIQKQYTYIIQLDSNLLIEQIPCDPIHVMILSRSLFGWYNAGIEVKSLVGNFNIQYQNYLQQYNLTSSNFDHHIPNYSGGFLILDLRLFTSRSYKHFIEFVDSTGLIFSKRLADQNIYGYAMRLLTYGNYMHHYSGYKFKHVGQNSWGGNDVYTNKIHPLWHLTKYDPYCNLTLSLLSNNSNSISANNKTMTTTTTTTKDDLLEKVQEEYFWNQQYEIREKNTKLASLYK